MCVCGGHLDSIQETQFGRNVRGTEPSEIVQKRQKERLLYLQDNLWNSLPHVMTSSIDDLKRELDNFMDVRSHRDY